MRLAEHCGYLHADEVLSRLTQAQLGDWFAYEEMTGHLGHDRNDIFAALSLSMFVNAHLNKEQQPVTFEDFDFYHITEVTDDDIEDKLNCLLGNPK